MEAARVCRHARSAARDLPPPTWDTAVEIDMNNRNKGPFSLALQILLHAQRIIHSTPLRESHAYLDASPGQIGSDPRLPPLCIDFDASEVIIPLVVCPDCFVLDWDRDDRTDTPFLAKGVGMPLFIACVCSCAGLRQPTRTAKCCGKCSRAAKANATTCPRPSSPSSPRHTSPATATLWPRHPRPG